MNRTDRLLAIVLELQGKRWRRAEDLAATFETSKRTIYRDILALGQAGVPVVSIPGRGYSLVEGYFLPPLSFTTDEATMLLLGSDFMQQNFDAQYRAAAQSAVRKIAGVLPQKLREEVDYLQSSIRFIALGAGGNTAELEMLRQLRRAIIDQTTVRFHYHTRHTDSGQSRHTTREADPYGLVHFPNNWHMIAYCHLRQDVRSFRLDRVESLEILPTSFQRPPHFKMRGPDHAEPRPVIVRALFDAEIMRWVREARSYFTVAEEECEEDLLLTLRVRHESEALQWLLGWGRHVRVLEPESLRITLAEEGQALMRNHQQLQFPSERPMLP